MALVHGLGCTITLLVTALSSPGSSPVNGLTDEAIGFARLGIMKFVDAHEADPFAIIDPCPIASAVEIRVLMEDQGYTPNVDGWAPNLEWELDHPTIECGPANVDLDRPNPTAPHGAFVVAMELTSADLRFEDLVEDHGATVAITKVEEIGGDIAILCRDDDVGICVADWHRAGLMITLGIWGPGEDVTQDRTIEMLTAFVPTAVRTLGGDAPETAPSET